MSRVLVEGVVAIAAVQGVAALAVFSARAQETRLRRWLPHVVGVAVGVLLATALAHLLPESLEQLHNSRWVWVVLVGTMALLFGFERVFHAVSGVRPEPAPSLADQECEEIHHHAHGSSRPVTLLLGAVTHSFVDGASVAAAFVVDFRLGWVTAIAVGLHEVPHRLGDFALLLHMDVPRRRASWLAVLAGMSGLVGWGLAAWLGAANPAVIAWLLPISAGSFLYISLVDLLPELMSERRPRAMAWQIFWIFVGVALGVGLTRLPGA
ncbi:ZIP family metal transporter [Granulicella cerasi]|uniref:ZIP family metal transporter n=1 Tax=Granulicella cerasi TaxID=741063 RepID=A0ABW1Z3Y7_9BACT|nr:ZIP family metal transporter [Granulicella cerasi]